MKDIKLFLEGFIIGIGKIIPGVSGAMFAMMFGVYEKSLYIISNLKTEFKKNIKFILILGISVVLAIILGSNIIKKCLDNYYLFTMMLFIGMMCGGIKPLFNNIKGEKFKLNNLITALIVVTILVILSVIEFKPNDGTLDKTPLTFIILIFSGFLDALATVVPGICGTALLMILGYYDTVITSLGDIFNISNIGHNAFVLIPFLIGMIIGIFIISIVVNYLFKHHKVKTYYSIIGFAITSILILLIDVFKYTYQVKDILYSYIFFIVGFIIVHFMEKNNKKS